MAWWASASSLARTNLPAPGKERMIAASRCSAMPRLGLPSGQLLDERVEASGHVLDLPVDQIQTVGRDRDMGAGSLRCAARHCQRWPFDDGYHVGCTDPADAMVGQDRATFSVRRVASAGVGALAHRASIHSASISSVR